MKALFTIAFKFFMRVQTFTTLIACFSRPSFAAQLETRYGKSIFAYKKMLCLSIIKLF